MSAIDHLVNGKDTIISIVSEYYFLNSKEIDGMEFRPFKSHNPSCNNIIRHSEWVFCYHRDVGVLYIE